jgi:hypothetical protein
MVIGNALVGGVLRLRSGSVWPAIVLHAAWNSIIQNPFDRSSVGPDVTLWVGESGVLVAVTTLIVGLVVYQRWRKDGAKSLAKDQPIGGTNVVSPETAPSQPHFSAADKATTAVPLPNLPAE